MVHGKANQIGSCKPMRDDNQLGEISPNKPEDAIMGKGKKKC